MERSDVVIVQRDSIFTKGPPDVLDHATNEIASGSKPGIVATKKLPRRLQTHLTAAHQDGCGGEGEGGKTVRRRCLKTGQCQQSTMIHDSWLLFDEVGYVTGAADVQPVRDPLS